MIGLDLMGADEPWGTDEKAPKYGSGGEGDLGPPVQAPKYGSGGDGDVGPPSFTTEKATKAKLESAPAKPSAAKPSTAVAKREAPSASDDAEGSAEVGDKKWIIVGGLAAAVIGALIFFFTGGAEKIR